MYLGYYGLEREPFTIAPAPAFLYPSPQHRQALAHLKYGLDREGGFILLTGEVGTGKTTLTRLLLEQLPGNVRVAYILNAKLNTRDVLASICSELHLEYSPEDSIKSLTDLINRDLLAAHAQGKKTLVVIEEAQNLDPEVLEMLRLLTNLETNTTKLLHILLVGQPELLDLIARNELRQLNQRVVSRFHLEPLNQAETANYMAHRLRRAGCNRPLFDPSAIRALHRLSGGIPRVLNLLGERALLGGFATGRKQVGAAVVEAASREVFGAVTKPKKPAGRGRPLVWTVAAALVVALGLGVYLIQPETPSPRLETALQAGAPEAERPAEATPEMPPAAAEPAGDVGESAPAAPEPPQRNVYELLLAIWGLSAENPQSLNELCAGARAQGLACQRDSALEFTELGEINRPGLLYLSPTEESRLLFLLESMDAGEAVLRNSAGEQRLPLNEFARQWQGDFIYLWPSPAPYDGLLLPGTRNPPLVSWLQEQLLEVVEGYEYIYNGGVYSPLIADRVAEFQRTQGLTPDGLLGPRTILRLLEQRQSLPVLVAPEAGLSASTAEDS